MTYSLCLVSYMVNIIFASTSACWHSDISIKLKAPLFPNTSQRRQHGCRQLVIISTAFCCPLDFFSGDFLWLLPLTRVRMGARHEHVKNCCAVAIAMSLFTSPHFPLLIKYIYRPVWSSDDLSFFSNKAKICRNIFVSPNQTISSAAKITTFPWIPPAPPPLHFHSKRRQWWLTRPCSLVYIRCGNNWHLYPCTCSESRGKAQQQRFYFTLEYDPSLLAPDVEARTWIPISKS